jgi:hypothetical protein
MRRISAGDAEAPPVRGGLGRHEAGFRPGFVGRPNRRRGNAGAPRIAGALVKLIGGRALFRRRRASR